jgi:hypothetical protein
MLCLHMIGRRGLKMKKLQLLLITLLLLMFGSPLYAAAVPNNAGRVTDAAGLFNSSQVKQIEDGLKGKGFEIFVLTARGLSESAAEQLGSDAYSSWKLGPKQLVMVVAAEPGSVHIVYDNEELAKSVSRTEAGNTKGILDLHYAPAAGKGNAADGIVAVSNYVNSLQVSAPTGPTGQAPVPAPSGAPVGAIEGVPVPPSPGTPSAGSNGAAAPGAAGGAAGAPGAAPAAGGASAGTPPAASAGTSQGLPFSYMVVIGIVIVGVIVAFALRRSNGSRK